MNLAETTDLNLMKLSYGKPLKTAQLNVAYFIAITYDHNKRFLLIVWKQPYFKSLPL